MDNVDGPDRTSGNQYQRVKNVTGNTSPVISVMLAVADTPEAIVWYMMALGATELWNFGPVAGLEIAGAAFFLGNQP